VSVADGEPDPMSYPRKVLFVAGAGRSGTSTLAGLMQILGLHVPQPEVVADATNPKGFGEPLWVVENHDRLLDRAGVQVGDARPEAWLETGRQAAKEAERIRVAQWLEEHLAVNPELVVKDPRLSWFLPLWRVAAIRTGATPVFATMLRPPAEVVGSKQTYYQNRLGSAHLAASWLNMMLHTERATRESVVDGGRVFVRYADLLDDWTRIVMRVGRQLGLEHVLHADADLIREGHRFVDPSLRRMTHTLEDLALPKRLHELTAETWEELNKLAEPDGDTSAVRAALDQLREGYVELYDESAAIARSSVVAAEHRARKQLTRRAARRGAPPAPDATGTVAGAAGATDRPATRAARDVPEGSRADRIPHAIRAAVPAPLRRGLRRALGRERS
jgi:hypothetical protein